MQVTATLGLPRTILTSALCFLILPGVFANTLTMASFNVKLYNSEKSEKDTELKQFVQAKLADSDILAFQEVIDKPKFYARVKPKNFHCRSYENHQSNHMHVVLCFKDKFDLKPVRGEKDFAFDEMAMQYYRPAVYGVLTDLKGKELAIVVALHLKAMQDGTEKRLAQIEKLARRINEVNDQQLPVVLLGDFNTFENEALEMSEIFYQNFLQFDHLEVAEDYTYRTTRYASKFDHFWVSSDISVEQEIDVSGPCNLDIDDQENRRILTQFNDHISDHCPVKTILNLPNR